MLPPIHILATALALAGGAGLRAFVPIFFLWHALRIDLITDRDLNPHVLSYLGQIDSPGAFTLLLLLCLGEMGLMKVPVLAHVLDLPFLLLRIVAAVVAAFVIMPIQDFGTGLTAAIVLGTMGALPIINLQASQISEETGAVPRVVHLTGSTLTDGIALGACSIALQMPYLGLAFVHVAMWMVLAFVSAWRRRSAHQLTMQTIASAPELPEDWHEHRKR